VVDGDELINYYFCYECKPKPGDKIIAKVGRDGIRIHTVACRGIKTISFDKLLEAHRSGQAETVYKVYIELKISNRHGNIIGMMNIFNDLHIPVLNVTMKNLQENMSLFSFETEFANPNKIAFLLNSLKKHDDSLKVIKKKIS
jgi:(p)ppGpp synthase/HD superfamily hydrolase